jgi:MFS family permease
MDGPVSAPFSRDKLTLLAYSGAVIVGFGLAAPGPAMPFLREELGISRTVGGAHFTAIALATIAVGLVAERMTGRWGRRTVFWVGEALLGVGTIVIGIGNHPALTIAGAALVGGSATAVLTVVQSSLADVHGPWRATALTEGNMSTSIGTILPAIAVGGFAAIGLGWRSALVLPACLWLLAWAWGRREPFPPAAVEPKRRVRARLPRRYWWYWAALVPGTSVEWALAAWGAGYLVEVGRTSEAAASLLMTAFFGAMAGGRFVVSRVAARLGPPKTLLWAVIVGLAGFLVLWASTAPAAIVAGLFVAGAGISGIFPMLLTLAVAAAPGRVDLAAARANLAAGIAFIVAPQTLGVAADRIGLRPGFGIVVGLFVATWLLASVGNRQAAARVTPPGAAEAPGRRRSPQQ